MVSSKVETRAYKSAEMMVVERDERTVERKALKKAVSKVEVMAVKMANH